MKLTELLVTGYDGDKVVLATDLTAEKAASVLAATGLSDGTTVEADAALAGPAFRQFVKTLGRLTTVDPYACGCCLGSSTAFDGDS